ncbi:MAG TPA: hypothetical protein VM032_16830 [Vicinamibacterales bacterium]|nr:hypothetical protein [Vicinamibacterales bacterium]
MQDTHTPAADMGGTPYRGIAGELVSDALALFLMVREARPEVTRFGSSALVLTFDMDAGQINVGLRLSPERVAIIEAISVDTAQPEAFGRSILPILTPEGVAH